MDVRLPRNKLFGSPGHLYDNHSTHSVTHDVSSNELAVARNKVVSTRKNACAGHVEILKVEGFRMRKGRKESAGTPRRPPMMPRGELTFWSIFIYLTLT